MVKKKFGENGPTDATKFVAELRAKAARDEKLSESEANALVLDGCFDEFNKRLPEFRKKLLNCDCLIDKTLGTLPQFYFAAMVNRQDLFADNFWTIMNLAHIDVVEKEHSNTDRFAQASLLGLDRSTILRRKQAGEALGFYPLNGARRVARLKTLQKASEALESTSEHVIDRGGA